MPGLNLLHQMDGHEIIVQSVAFSPSGTLLASGSVQGILIWSVPSGRLITTLNEHQSLVYDLEFHPNESWLTSVSLDGTIRTWGVLP